MTANAQLSHPLPPAAARPLLHMLEGLACGELELTTPQGQRLCFSGPAPGPRADLHIRNWRVCSALLTGGEVGFAESFRAGHWSSRDLTALLMLAAVNETALAAAQYGRGWVRLLYRLRHLLRANSRRGSRRNIHAHYDIGNDFYRLWLDASMTYSAALFSEPQQPLAWAQQEKYERILQRLDVGPDDHILEIGCGWGGFAAHAARTRGCRVTGITLSSEQLHYASQRGEAEGLGARVRFDLCDYRDVPGRYDHIVSIEMLEAVGEHYWPSYFEVVRERLRPGGRALIQTITIADERFDNYRRYSDFIQQYIFPGGMLPSPRRLRAVTAAAGLTVADEFRFGADYARTLQRWRERFEARAEALRRLGFDDGFQRLWRFYLAYCEAGFRCGYTDVVQLELCRD